MSGPTAEALAWRKRADDLMAEGVLVGARFAAENLCECGESVLIEMESVA